MIFKGKSQRGIIPLKMKVELRFFFSAHCQIVVYISTSFMKIFWMVSNIPDFKRQPGNAVGLIEYIDL